MQLTYYGYNAFIIKGRARTIIMDPGQDLHWRRLSSLVPKTLWEQADLILVTHGDPDHAEYVASVAHASGAPIVCGPALTAKWQTQGLEVVPIASGERVVTAGVQMQGVPVQHGGLPLKLFGHTITLKPRFVGTGAVGLLFVLDDQRVLNLGDTLFLKDAWSGLRPNILMVPIGGMMTMDVDEALKAVELIEPDIVIPMHFDWQILFYRSPVDVKRFAAEVDRMGSMCLTLNPGETAEL
jgi:L-ascorbate metabolism protein UlaG (beta-lactamase superfamily)